MSNDIRITTGDGQQLHGTVCAPDGARTWLLINSAMGVRRRFYRHLALHLAGKGIGVVTYDYRGIGDSVLDEDNARRVRLEDWGREDFPSVLRWLRRQQDPQRIVVLGHSVGGQLLGIQPEIRDIDAIVGVAAQSGHWRHWDGVDRVKVLGLWYVAIPLLTRVCGAFPASRLGLGQDIPTGIARQWAEWGKDPAYIRSRSVGPQPQYHDEVRCRLRTYQIERDHLASERALRAWHDWFPNAQRELVNLGSHSREGRKIGHFGFFDPDVGAGEWPRLADFVRG